jgi:uncharacterized membrane protein
MHVIHQSWAHLHILVSVFPSVGLVFVLGVYIAGFRTRNDFVRRTCLVLLAGLALLSIPIYVSGVGSAAALSGNARFSKDMIATHYTWGVAALVILLIAGFAAGFELWRAWRARRESKDPFHLVLALGLVALALTIVAGELGFEINHHELDLIVTIPDISTPYHSEPHPDGRVGVRACFLCDRARCK